MRAEISKKEQNLLQWGRNFFVTEINHISPSSQEVSELQWGRNFFVTEIDGVRQGDERETRASMGP